jgi:hypothetical protein
MKGSHKTQINHKRYGERPSAIASSRASFGLLIGVFFNSLFRYRRRLSVSFYNEAGRLSSAMDVTLGFPFSSATIYTFTLCFWAIVLVPLRSTKFPQIQPHPAAINMIAASCRFTIALCELMFIVNTAFLYSCNCSVNSICSSG